MIECNCHPFQKKKLKYFIRMQVKGMFFSFLNIAICNWFFLSIKKMKKFSRLVLDLLMFVYAIDISHNETLISTWLVLRIIDELGQSIC